MINNHRTAIAALFLSVVVMAFQDVYLATRLDSIHPAELIVLMFTCVNIVAFAGLILHRPKWPKLTAGNLWIHVLFNLSTAASWIGTFIALKNLQPTVVSALTLSVPPTFSALQSIKNKQGLANRLIGTILVVAGIALALFGGAELNFEFTKTTLMGLASSLVAALGVWGNAEFSRSLSRRGYTTNQTFCLRFILLTAASALYLFSGPYYTELSKTDVGVFSAVAVFTFYFPMLLLYRSSSLLSVHSVTIGLALTPLVTLLMQSFSRFQTTPQECLGMILLAAGVIVGVMNQPGETA